MNNQGCLLKWRDFSVPSREARFFFAPSGRWPAYRQRYEGIIISNGKRTSQK